MRINITRHTYKRLRMFDSVFVKNPVLFFGLSIASVVTISTSLKAGVALSIAAFIIMFPTVLLASLIADSFQKGQRIVLYCLMGSVFYIPAFLLVKTFFPDVLNIVGVFMPLLVVNQILIIKSNYHSHVKKPFIALCDIFFSVTGFSLVLCLVSLIREVLGSGTIWGLTVTDITVIPAIVLPFSGFILLGFICALAAFIKRKTNSSLVISD